MFQNLKSQSLPQLSKRKPMKNRWKTPRFLLLPLLLLLFLLFLELLKVRTSQAKGHGWWSLCLCLYVSCGKKHVLKIVYPLPNEWNKMEASVQSSRSRSNALSASRCLWSSCCPTEELRFIVRASLESTWNTKRKPSLWLCFVPLNFFSTELSHDPTVFQHLRPHMH